MTSESLTALSPGFYIAPCGMNCSICIAFLRPKNKCKGCRAINQNMPISRTRCKIKNCEKRASDYCITCGEFPCIQLTRLDKRYRLKYHMSMIENLINIREMGIEEFAKAEKIRWTCPVCRGTICAHTYTCLDCANA